MRPPAAATVSIDGVPAQRQGEWFRGEFDAPNQNGAVYPTNTVRVVQGGVTNTAAVTTFVPPHTLDYQHDADGNLTRDARWDYAWDAENRLLRVSTRDDLPPAVPRVTIAFTYDPAGRRIRKLVTDAAGATVSELRYLWHQNHLIMEVNGQNLALRTYQWGPDISGTFDGAAGAGGLYNINGISGDNGPMWGDYANILPAHDGRGNIIGLGNRDYGSLWAQFEYDPYGRTVSEKFYPGASSHVPKVRLRYNTRLTDPETGHIYYRFRHYSPHLGRWLNRDPIGERGGLNLFGMVGNDPVNRLDPLGLEPIIHGSDEQLIRVPFDVGPLHPGDQPVSASPLAGSLRPLPSVDRAMEEMWAQIEAQRMLEEARRQEEAARWAESRACGARVLKNIGIAGAAGAAGILTGTFTGGALLPYLSTTLGWSSGTAAVTAGVAAGSAGGLATQCTSNALHVAPLLEGTRSAMLWGGAFGGGLAFAGKVIASFRQGFREAREAVRAMQSPPAPSNSPASGTNPAVPVCPESPPPVMGANGLPLGPGAMNADEILERLRAAGRYDVGPAGSSDEALSLARRAFPGAVELPPAFPGKPYPSPPPGVKKWFQLHPADPGVNELPHVKYVDWTSGKKGAGGSWGHIYFEAN